MNITHLSQKLGLVVLTGFAVGALSSCNFVPHYATPPEEVPLVKKGEVLKHYHCGYRFYTIDNKTKTITYADDYDKLIFKTNQKIFTYSICSTRSEKKGATNNPESVVLYVTEAGNGKIIRESPSPDSIRDSNKKSIVYTKAGTYKQKHYVFTSKGDEFAVKYFTVTIVDDK